MMSFEVGEINPNTPHLFADFAELLVLVDQNGRGWIHKNDLLDWRTFASTSLDEVDDEEEKAEEMERLGGDAKRREREELQLQDVWTHLEYRSISAMRPYYPFEIEGEKLRLVHGFKDVRFRAYRLLLACSRLRSFPSKGGVRQRWAKWFTELSRLALGGLMPNHAAVRIFDANSEDRRNHYKTDFREALIKLAQDLGFNPVKEACQKADPSGDGGLDLVGVVDFGDGAIGNFAVAGQCGAQEKEWPTKRLEATPINFRSYLNPLFDWPSVMFTPVCYRNSTGEWVDNQKSTGVLLMDRLRILLMLEKSASWDCLSRADWLKAFDDEFSQVGLDA